MTLPDERYRAVLRTQELVIEILTTPHVPKAIKDNGRYCLRLYPNAWDMKLAAEKCPDIFAEHIEDVQRMFVKYEQGKKDEA